jgi:RNA polymerase sigma-70 factor, ECF subfamily
MAAGDDDELADAELARRVGAAGPEAARAEALLCRRFGERVRLFGIRHLRDDQAAAELVQRVLLVVLEKLRAGQVREPDRIGSFVLGVARMLVHESRRSRREDELPSDDAAAALAVSPPVVELFAGARLVDCLHELPERERSIVVLTYYAEQGAKEIAQALGLAETHVRVSRHRALARLRRCLGLGEEDVA